MGVQHCLSACSFEFTLRWGGSACYFWFLWGSGDLSTFTLCCLNIHWKYILLQWLYFQVSAPTRFHPSALRDIVTCKMPPLSLPPLLWLLSVVLIGPKLCVLCQRQQKGTSNEDQNRVTQWESDSDKKWHEVLLHCYLSHCITQSIISAFLLSLAQHMQVRSV